ncbi:hypothetical protein Tco_0370227, partial [Tanacetum coccineum]
AVPLELSISQLVRVSAPIGLDIVSTLGELVSALGHLESALDHLESAPVHLAIQTI